MISQNLPIASQLLKNVAHEWMTFRFGHGVTATSLRELAHALADMNQVEFDHYVRKDGNDIALWVEIVIGDRRLAAKLRLLTTPEAAGRMVLRRVEELTATLPVGPSTEEVVVQLDIALAVAARRAPRPEKELVMAVSDAPVAAAATPRKRTAKRASAARGSSSSAAPASKRAPKALKKKPSFFAKLLGW